MASVDAEARRSADERWQEIESLSETADLIDKRLAEAIKAEADFKGAVQAGMVADALSQTRDQALRRPRARSVVPLRQSTPEQGTHLAVGGIDLSCSDPFAPDSVSVG
jgi:hypothetical protein